MAIETIEDAQHEVAVMIEEMQADLGDEVDIDPRDCVVSVSFNIEDDELARELCRVELGFVPYELEPRLGARDFLDS